MTSHSSAIRSQRKKKSWKFCLWFFWNCESTCDLTDIPASFNYRKMDARPFNTFHDILQWLSLVQSLLEDRNAPISRKQEPTHMRLFGNDRLNLPKTSKFEFNMSSFGLLFTRIIFIIFQPRIEIKFIIKDCFSHSTKKSKSQKNL